MREKSKNALGAPVQLWLSDCHTPWDHLWKDMFRLITTPQRWTIEEALWEGLGDSLKGVDNAINAPIPGAETRT